MRKACSDHASSYIFHYCSCRQTNLSVNSTDAPKELCKAWRIQFLRESRFTICAYKARLLQQEQLDFMFIHQSEGVCAPRTEFTDPLGAVGGGLIATPRLSVCLSVCSGGRGGRDPPAPMWKQLAVCSHIGGGSRRPRPTRPDV